MSRGSLCRVSVKSSTKCAKYPNYRFPRYVYCGDSLAVSLLDHKSLCHRTEGSRYTMTLRVRCIKNICRQADYWIAHLRENPDFTFWSIIFQTACPRPDGRPTRNTTIAEKRMVAEQHKTKTIAC